jgi:hypothetical protein
VPTQCPNDSTRCESNASRAARATVERVRQQVTVGLLNLLDRDREAGERMPEPVRGSVLVHGKLVHPDDPDLNAHVHAAVARHSRRGWRLERPDRTTNIDAVVALAMAIDRHAYQPEPVELLGWV